MSDGRNPLIEVPFPRHVKLGDKVLKHMCILLGKILPFGSTKHRAQLTETDFILFYFSHIFFHIYFHIYFSHIFLQGSYVFHIVQFYEQ